MGHWWRRSTTDGYGVADRPLAGGRRGPQVSSGGRQSTDVADDGAVATPERHGVGMDGPLSRAAATQGGYFFRHQALDAGYSEKEIAALLRSRQWRKLRRGAYTTTQTWDGLDEAGRHVLLVRAVADALEGRVVVTGSSALAVLGGPLWGVDLAEVHVHREDGKTPRREAGVVHHVGALPDDELIEVDGLLVPIPERSAFEACRRAPFEAGVALLDGLRFRLPFDVGRASEIIERCRDWSGSVRASRVLRFSTDLAATVGESRCRVLMARIGLPVPVLQHPVHDESGTLLGITDFYLEEYATVAEFDGKLKYGRALYEESGRVEDVDLGEVLWNEKRREDSIREQGNEMVRVVWFELDGHDDRVRGRFDRAFHRSGLRRSAV
jgi:hypothetical protein